MSIRLAGRGLVRLDLDVFGDEQISRELLRFSAHAGNAQPAFHKIAQDMREQIKEQFGTEGDRGSGGWAPLKEATIAAKASAGLDPHILQATHSLMESLTGSAGDHIEEITDDSLLFGSSDPKGRFHQKGTSRMPARKPVDFTELDRRGFVRTLQKYIVHGTV
jgi:phage gpG-like protein